MTSSKLISRSIGMIVIDHAFHVASKQGIDFQSVKFGKH